jgi:hypothetical protein
MSDARIQSRDAPAAIEPLHEATARALDTRRYSTLAALSRRDRRVQRGAQKGLNAVASIQFEHVTKRYMDGFEAIRDMSLERRAKALASPPASRADDGVGQRAGARHGRLGSRLGRLQMRPRRAGRKLARVREKETGER